MIKQRMPDDTMRNIQDEVEQIRSLLEIIAEDAIRSKLGVIATTRNRKRLWTLIDGKKSTSDLAKDVGIDIRSVQQFVSELVDRGLVNVVRRGHPRRRYEIVPKEWK